MCISVMGLSGGTSHLIDPLHDDVKNQNKPGALCIVGFIGGSAER